MIFQEYYEIIRNSTKSSEYLSPIELRIFVQALLSEGVKGNKDEAAQIAGVERRNNPWLKRLLINVNVQSCIQVASKHLIKLNIQNYIQELQNLLKPVVRAEYSKETANEQASHLLAKINIQNYIRLASENLLKLMVQN